MSRPEGPPRCFDSNRVRLVHRHLGHEAEADVDTGSDSLGPDSDSDLTRISSGSCSCFKFTSLLRVGTLGMTDAVGCCVSCHHALSNLTKWSSASMHYYVTQSREGYIRRRPLRVNPATGPVVKGRMSLLDKEQ
jgi:hypothetical protein